MLVRPTFGKLNSFHWYKLVASLLVIVGLLTWPQQVALAQTKQKISFTGTVLEEDGSPVVGCQVYPRTGGDASFTDASGNYELVARTAHNTVTLFFRHPGYRPYSITLNLVKGQLAYKVDAKLEAIHSVTTEVEVLSDERLRDLPSMTEIKPRDVKNLPSAFGDFNMILATLPGVVSNNELSSQYSVRGGNYDENLVYVNDIEIYRPFLVRAGQQEGLSFVNPDMVQSVEFSTGGWQPRFGDKLSSVMNVNYKTPEKFGGTLTAGILNQAATLEGTAFNKKMTWVAGVRRKASQYLFQRSFLTGGLPVTGEYLPTFVDAQSYINLDLTSKRDSAAGRKMSLSFLGSYAYNDYLVRPRDRETEFGTLTNTFRLSMAFAGQERLFYSTYQAGLKFSRTFSEHFRSDVTFSAVSTSERERIDVEGAYRLCDVQKDPSRPDFNQCIFERGVGSFYQYGRNDLDGTILNILNRNYWKLSPEHRIEFGLNVAQERISDRLDEYNFVDSSDFVKVSQVIFAQNTTLTHRVGGYVQHNWLPSATTSITYGLRMLYSDLNQQVLWSPRAQFSYKPEGERDIIFKLAAGLYHQPPFYREMRDLTGSVNTRLLAQSSAHFVAGADYKLQLWNRPFKVTGELYYKNLWNVVAYDVDNVRLRYFGNNGTRAYAIGADARISGELINGAESWFSLGVMQTREQIDNYSDGWVRRPTDQLVTAAIFFQDHLPNAPSARVYVNAIFGSGLAFGPPGDAQNRSQVSGPFYRRVDVGFSKIYVLTRGKGAGNVFDNIWVGLEVLNLLGVDNTISYLWVKDVNNTQFAVPNTLSARFFNLRIIGTLK